MKASDDLFQLIKSLTKGQKRYFKLYSSLYEGNKTYLKLFYAIDKQQQYNEKAIKKEFHQENFIKQLTRTKHYLYQLILRVMYTSRSDGSIIGQLQGLYGDALFLLNNSLYKQSKKIVIKGKQLANKYEQHHSLLAFLRLESKLMSAQSYSGKTEKDIDRLYQEFDNAFEKYSNTNQYDRLLSKMIIKRTHHGNPRDVAKLQDYAQLMENPLLQDEKKALSYHALYDFYASKTAYCTFKNDFINSYIYAQKAVKLMEENPHQIAIAPLQYALALRHLLITQLDLKKFNEMPDILKKMKAIKVKQQIAQDKIFFRGNIMELAMYNQSGQFDKAEKLMNEILEKMEKTGENIMNKENITVLYYTFACIYIGLEKYHKAIIYLNKILHAPMDVRNDIQCFAKILNLIVHFELGNIDLLEYSVKSTYRFLYKRNRLYSLETIILNFIRKQLPKISSKKELETAFKRLKENIIDTCHNAFEKAALDYFDFISWLESRIEGKTFSEVVKKKVIAHQF